MKKLNVFCGRTGRLVGVVTVATVSALVATQASAVSYLDSSASAIVTQVQTDAVTAQGYGWVLLGTVFFGLLVMGIFKRFTAKGTGR